MVQEFFKNLRNSFPLKVFLLIIASWAVLAGINLILFLSHFYTGVGILYPFSVIYPNAFLPGSFLFASLFLLLGFYAIKNIKTLNLFYVFLFSFCLLLAGNLAQGNADIAFMQPFYLKGRQYYTDAVQIRNWQIWLNGFTNNLESFQLHTRTHPPFTTLIHFFILKIFGGNIMLLGISFFMISFSGIFAVYKSLRLLKFEKFQAKKVSLLFSIIPSVNIYSLVSVDGIILSLTCFFLYGLLLLTSIKRRLIVGILICTVSSILINCLSFSGLFLVAFLGILSLIYLSKRDLTVFFLSLFLIFSSIVFFWLIFKLTGYNQYTCFRLASHSENPLGFMPFVQPKLYFFTRLEDVGEIFFFLSFALLAVIFSKKFFKKVGRNQKYLFYSACLALATMFLTGAYGTGETARACLFIVPFFIFLFKNVNSKTFEILFILCLLQTFAMQLVGNFYW